MPAKYVLASSHDLDPIDIMREENVDIRRELIRKVGIETMLKALPHEVLDKRDDYELLRIDFPGLVEDARYLKMLNPSIGVWHLEGADRACKTVQEAINWRAGKFAESDDWAPAQLT